MTDPHRGVLPEVLREVPFDLDRIFRALDEFTIFMAVGTSAVVEPAASFVAHVGRSCANNLHRAGRVCERVGAY